MTGQGEALGMVEYEGRWMIAPSAVRIEGGGWTGGRVAVDGFQRATTDGTTTVLRNDGFEPQIHRQPAPGPRPNMALAATVPGEPAPVILAEITPLS